MVTTEAKVLQAQTEITAPQEHRAPRAQLVTKVILVHKAPQERLATKAIKATLVSREPQEQLVQLVTKAIKATKAILVLKALQEQLVQLVTRAIKDHKAIKAILVPKAQLESKGQQPVQHLSLLIRELEFTLQVQELHILL
jgi:hypothetical protein